MVDSSGCYCLRHFQFEPRLPTPACLLTLANGEKIGGRGPSPRLVQKLFKHAFRYNPKALRSGSKSSRLSSGLRELTGNEPAERSASLVRFVIRGSVAFSAGRRHPSQKTASLAAGRAT